MTGMKSPKQSSNRHLKVENPRQTSQTPHPLHPPQALNRPQLTQRPKLRYLATRRVAQKFSKWLRVQHRHNPLEGLVACATGTATQS